MLAGSRLSDHDPFRRSACPLQNQIWAKPGGIHKEIVFGHGVRPLIGAAPLAHRASPVERMNFFKIPRRKAHFYARLPACKSLKLYPAILVGRSGNMSRSAR